ncbi:transporter major facilitator family protein [Thermosipho africanus Ob7]|jgi:MFS family permease|uniref:MFS transporter n=1 Tax=Thermosipho africanus TaxID=2421 RepID=UPI000E0C715C|nr:MFS transporter [Thermosipho africanus]RDI92663.1 transporter major facilitator family protein [Thermosipho africanus Ob7]HCF37988.1 MFS transporter [Thermosipho africanus]
MIKKDKQFRKFQMYGFLKNLRFFEPFLILFFLSSGLSYLQIGILYSIKSIATNILEIPTGVIADLYGRKKSMLFSMISYIISFLIFYFSRSFYLYILAMIFFSFGEAFRTGTHKAMIFQYLKINGMENLKVQYYGATRAASQLGSALNSLIAASIVFVSGNYRTVFFIAILPYILNLINLATYPNELDKAEVKKTKKQTLKDFIDAVASWRVLKILLNTSSYSAIFKSLKDYLQPILESFALSIPIFVWLDDKKRSSIVIGIVYFFLYLLTSYASKNSWKIGKKSSSFALNLTLFVGALSVIFAGVSYIFNFYIVSILIFIVLYILENLRRPIAVSYVGDNVESDALASVLSVESQATTLLTAVFSIVLGFFADKLGVGQAVSILGIILLLMSLFFKIKD